MTIIEMLSQSGLMTLLGMGVVFSFLLILVIVISQFGKLINPIGSDNNAAFPAANTSNKSTGTAASAENNPEIIAATTAAVTEYNKKQFPEK